MTKLLLDSLKGVKLQKNSAKVLSQKFALDAKILTLRYVRISKNRHFKFSPVDFRHYRTSGENKKKLVFEFFLGCRNSFGNILLRQKMIWRLKKASLAATSCFDSYILSQDSWQKNQKRSYVPFLSYLTKIKYPSLKTNQSSIKIDRVEEVFWDKYPVSGFERWDQLIWLHRVTNLKVLKYILIY